MARKQTPLRPYFEQMPEIGKSLSGLKLSVQKRMLR
jgi:hypothetical protein